MRNKMKRWAVMVLSGSMLLQTGGCAEISTVVTGIATSITAGGVIYLVARIFET